MDRRELFLYVLEQNLFKPYLWGGNDPIAGFDCSGLVIEGLKSTGILPKSGDWTAEDLFNKFRHGLPGFKDVTELQPGTLLFWDWNNVGKKVHVEVVWHIIDGIAYTIGASGGGSKTDSLQDAIDQDAYVKIRPAAAGWVGADPF